VDFLVGAKPRLNPCAHLLAEPRFGSGFCPQGGAAETNIAEQFAIMSPIPHEVQARTGHSLAFPGLITLDINGEQATNGQYLFPFGVGLGGISFPEMVEIDLNALNTPLNFTGLPWALDRRLSPAGCIDTNGDGIVDCESTPQPLDPFPFEGVSMDPRTLASVPQGPYNDPNFTTQPLSRTANRILSFVDAQGRFQGNSSVLAWPAVDPPFQPIPPTPEFVLDFSVVAPGTAPTVTGATLTASAPSPQVTGTAVVFTAAATGGSPADYQFQFWLNDGSGWVVTQPYSGSANWLLPTSTPPGDYDVAVWVRASSAVPVEAGTSMFYRISAPTIAPASSVTLAADLPNPQLAGTAVTFTASAQGSTAPYQYQFWVNSGSGFQIVQPYGTKNSYTLPSTTPAGVYDIAVWVRTTDTSPVDTGTSMAFAIQ
jgi:hypothetical protein